MQVLQESFNYFIIDNKFLCTELGSGFFLLNISLEKEKEIEIMLVKTGNILDLVYDYQHGIEKLNTDYLWYFGLSKNKYVLTSAYFFNSVSGKFHFSEENEIYDIAMAKDGDFFIFNLFLFFELQQDITGMYESWANNSSSILFSKIKHLESEVFE